MPTDLRNHPHLEMVERGWLRPNPKHPRKHPKRQLDKLTDAIRRFGFFDPIICDDDGLIVAGVARWHAAGALDLAEVPVIRARFVTEADRRAFVLAHSKLGELAEWDDQLLAEELEFLFDQEFDLAITGFDLGDLDFSLAGKPAAEPPVELPAADAVAVTRPGDLWLIGPHRLLCGNAREPESYERLLAGELATMIFADPPYNVPIDGHVSGLGKVAHREFAEASGEMSPAEFTAFLRTVFRNSARFSTNGSIHFHCIDWRHMGEVRDAGDGIYSLKQLVVWNKDNAGMGSFYRSQHELIFVFKSGRERHINNFGLGEKGRHRTNVWSYAGANSFRRGRAQDLADHPTVKPVAMIADAILDCSHRGNLILDPFSGSGTTLIAAHRTKRRGAAIEIDPLYCDVTLKRLGTASGLAVLHADGRTFEEVARDRAAESGHE